MSSQVIGNGPIGFTDSNGSQRFIPLSVLEFSDGKISAEKWPLYKANEDIVKAILEDLVDNGFLRPGPSPPAKPAMVLKAAVPGAAGNSIRVVFSNLEVDPDPDKTTFDATITAKDPYVGLNYDQNPPEAFIKNVLGTEKLAGTSPTVICVKDETISQPPTAGSYQLENGDNETKSGKAINAASGTAFTVEAWKKGSEGNNITVTISDVDPDTSTFTLVVELKPLTIPNITLNNLKTLLQGSGIVLTVTEPDEGFALPALGTIGLSGGSDAKDAASASATIVAKT